MCFIILYTDSTTEFAATCLLTLPQAPLSTRQVLVPIKHTHGSDAHAGPLRYCIIRAVAAAALARVQPMHADTSTEIRKQKAQLLLDPSFPDPSLCPGVQPRPSSSLFFLAPSSMHRVLPSPGRGRGTGPPRPDKGSTCSQPGGDHPNPCSLLLRSLLALPPLFFGGSSEDPHPPPFA